MVPCAPSPNLSILLGSPNYSTPYHSFLYFLFSASFVWSLIFNPFLPRNCLAPHRRFGQYALGFLSSLSPLIIIILIKRKKNLNWWNAGGYMSIRAQTYYISLNVTRILEDSSCVNAVATCCSWHPFKVADWLLHCPEVNYQSPNYVCSEK